MQEFQFLATCVNIVKDPPWTALLWPCKQAQFHAPLGILLSQLWWKALWGLYFNLEMVSIILRYHCRISMIFSFLLQRGPISSLVSVSSPVHGSYPQTWNLNSKLIQDTCESSPWSTELIDSILTYRCAIYNKPPKGTDQQQLFLVLKVELHGVVMITML